MTPPARFRPLLAAALLSLVTAGVAWAQLAAPPPARPAPAQLAQVVKVEASPSWNELTTAQRQALQPLAGTWARLGEGHKRKWIALSANYPSMPPAEQARLHSRMGEWAALSPQQRTQARLNFAETQKVPAGDRKALWDAYQALPPEETRKLAAGARAKPLAPPTAAAVQPVPRQKLARVPKPQDKNDPRSPRIAVVPPQPLEPDSFAPTPASPAQP